jgi:chemotaxis protein CheC
MDNKLNMDALKEVVNIGTGQAATSLSEILNQKVLINVPEVNLIPIEEVPEQLGGANKNIIGVYFQTSGELESRILLIFQQEAGRTLSSLLTGEKKPSAEQLDDMEKSSIMEVGNIIANSYINALSELLDIKLFPSIPYYAEDMLGAVIDFLLIEISQVADYSLLLKTNMRAESLDLMGNFIIFPDENFLTKLFEKLKLKQITE